MVCKVSANFCGQRGVACSAKRASTAINLDLLDGRGAGRIRFTHKSNYISGNGIRDHPAAFIS
jgi:hypothetical protein